MSDLIDRQAAYNTLTNYYHHRTEVQHDALKDALSRVPSAQQWIPCSERLPGDDTEVFVYLFDRDSPYIAWVRDSKWYTEEFEVDQEYEPRAWMPLPSPWKGEEE